MKLSLTQHSSTTVLSPEGVINQSVVAEFEHWIMDAVEAACKSDRDIVINLRGVSYMSSIGLRALMMAFKQTQGSACKMVLCGLEKRLQEIFSISRFDTVFQVFEDCDAAVLELENR